MNKSDFPEISVNGDKPGAFARNNKVYFPIYEEDNDFIRFVRKQEQSLIHEIFHLVTKNNLELQDLVIDEKNNWTI